MTNPNLTSIAVVLDRSGSMSACLVPTIDGFNSFIAEQRKAPGECEVSLVQFNNVPETIYIARRLSEVADLNLHTYVPRGETALYDAVGKTIMELGVRLAATPEEQRPGRVVVVIITDGEENASKTYTREQVKAMTMHQQSKYGWHFVYLGANQDAVREGTSIGLSSLNSMTYSTSNSKAVFEVTGGKLSVLRSACATDFSAQAQALAYTADERKDAVK